MLFTKPKYLSLLLRIGLAVCMGISMAKAQNFEVNTATYLGGPSLLDEMNAVDIGIDGSIIAGGKLAGYNPGNVKPVNLLGGGDGVIIRLNKTGTEVLSITRVGNTITDLEVGPDGSIAVTGSFGVGLLRRDGAGFLWADTTIKKGTIAAHTSTFFGYYAYVKERYKRAMQRVAIGINGTVATLQDTKLIYAGDGSSETYIYVYDKDGKKLTTQFITDKYPEDICVDDANKSYIVGGWNTLKANSRFMPNHPIHMPFMRAYSFDGQLKWKNYEWTAAQVYSIDYYADSRINEVIIGQDGMLYMAGYIHGGDHMYALGPKQYTDRSRKEINFDAYSSTANMGAGIDQGYIGMYDPKNGDVLKLQPVMVRKEPNGGGKPNQSLIKGIQVDENGNIYMAGYCEPYIRSRSSQQINGMPVGDVLNSEAFLMILDASWRRRNVWTVFSNGGESAAWGVGYRNGAGAIAAEVFEGEVLTTENALQATKSNGYEGYIVSWGQFKETTLPPLPPLPVSIQGNVPDARPSLYWDKHSRALDVRQLHAAPLAVELYNTNGKRVFAGQNNDQHTLFPIGGLTPGFYVAKITNQQSVFTQKILIVNE